MHKFIIASAAGFMFLPTAFAQQTSQFGTADQAKAMLVKVVAAVKADKTKALDMFNKGEGGFRDGDLFPFCFNLSDGKVVATKVQIYLGTDIRAVKAPNGDAFGEEQYKASHRPEGQITEISAMYPKPGSDKTPFPKVNLVTGVGDLGCVVGYYK